MNPFDAVVSAMRLESSLYVRLRARAPWGIAFDSGYQARLLIVPIIIAAIVAVIAMPYLPKGWNAIAGAVAGSRVRA